MEEDSNPQSSAQRFRKLISQRMVVGTFSKSQDPAFIEIIGHAGFDFVVLDLEHGPNTVLSLQNLIRAAEVTGLVPIVRVKEDTPSLISEVLDAGAAGIQVPQISAKSEAEEVLQAARFNPLGMRGVCRFVRAADYSSLDRYEYFARANTTVIVMQLEGVGAVENIQEILSVPGLDIVFIGPYDLSQSLGSRIGGCIRRANQARDRRYIYDHSPFSFHHARQKLPGNQKHAFQVRIEDTVPRFLIQVGNPTWSPDAGIVHEDVDLGVIF